MGIRIHILVESYQSKLISLLYPHPFKCSYYACVHTLVHPEELGVGVGWFGRSREGMGRVGSGEDGVEVGWAMGGEELVIGVGWSSEENPRWTCSQKAFVVI